MPFVIFVGSIYVLSLAYMAEISKNYSVILLALWNFTHVETIIRPGPGIPGLIYGSGSL